MLVVTRHKGLLAYLKTIGLADNGTQVIEHATADQLRGQTVVGVLPLHLAAAADYVIEIPMNIPPELRGVELDETQVAQYAGDARTYKVTCLEDVMRGGRL